jgi:hypothetical protein
MPDVERPTAAQIAAAADRWVELEHEALRLISKMEALVREGSPSSNRRITPLFSLISDDILGPLDKARSALWAAHKVVAAHGYDNHRRARLEADAGKIADG